MLTQFTESLNFNPRLREGGDDLGGWDCIDTDDFNPRLREGGDVSGGKAPFGIGDFNPRLREGGDGNIL